MVADTLGLRRRVLGLPRSVSRLQAAIMDFVPGKPFSTDNFRSLLTDSIGSADGLQELGINPRSLRPNLEAALGGSGLTGIMDSYRKSARR
jgi:NADH dehydrogenase